tara:strand:- start:799 stop:1170 length:372 start_codon:yes stop_codon:yes gene_type:complete
MSVERINLEAVNRIFTNQVKEKFTCVIKFYSNECQYCHDLADHYKEISQQFDDVSFFAYNTHEDPAEMQIEAMGMKLNGVPTLVLAQVGGRRPKKVVLSDPDEPHPETWYYPEDIINFIKKEK